MPQQQIFTMAKLLKRIAIITLAPNITMIVSLMRARSNDKIIKAINHKKYKITAIMWHPERLFPFHDDYFF